MSFLWGAATSSYQTEGGITNNDWHYFTTNPQIKLRILKMTSPNLLYSKTRQALLQPANDAAGFWEPRIYKTDFKNASQIGLNSLRISLEWSRLEPHRNEWKDDVLEAYKNMIICMKENKLIPIVTLNHFTLPLWVLTPPTNYKKRLTQYFLPQPLKDLPLNDPPKADMFWESLRGWENPETVNTFVKFVKYVVAELKGYVDYWITLNEPVTFIVGGGYLAGIGPPGFFLDGHRARCALHNLIEAHVQAYNMITEIDDIDADGDGISKTVGISHAVVAVEPDKPRNFLGMNLVNNNNSAKNFSYFVNDYFLNAIVNGFEDLNYLDTLERLNKQNKQFIVHDDWRNKVDFIGINYYRRIRVYYNPIVAFSSAKFIGGVFDDDNLNKRRTQNSRLTNDLGWEIYPLGLYNSLQEIWKKWNKPILITENGVPDKNDNCKAPFIIGHIRQVRRSILEGVNVIGYLYWSLFDSYEWHQGYSEDSRFGLFHVGKTKLNERIITSGARALEMVIQESSQENEEDISESAIVEALKVYGSYSADGTRIE
jgi:beta-glucosidase